ncbi:MAG TPA: cupin domain-containing protein [Solirubrobacteraceae bacterium]|nr:cupin domain-containing protein [Solirubrobacteraceae bacterium]
MHLSHYDDIRPFVTKDGSEIRDWAGVGGLSTSIPAVNQSLAEATIAPGSSTQAHHHVRTEELYLVVEGTGRLRVGDDERDLAQGDCALIPPGAEHEIVNTGSGPLRILCACAPAYSDEDTVLTEG